ncbi:MAG: hypothetical protein QXL94_01270 [Candidatus Parvarchaeum sp.]
MNSGFYEAVFISFVGISIIVSVTRFILVFYKNPLKAVQLIRLSKSSVNVFVIFLSMNFIFLAGYALQIFYSNNSNSDLIGILIYALGTSFFFFALTSIISKKYRLD